MDDLLRKLGLPALPIGDLGAASQEFARFIDTFQGDTKLDPAKLGKYLGWTTAPTA